MQAQKLIPFGVAIVCLAMVAGCTAAPQPAPATPVPATATPVPPAAGMPDTVKAYQDAFNRHDAEAAAALFVDDGLMFLGMDSIRANDKPGLRDYLMYEFALGATSTISDCTSDGDRWHSALAGRDDCSEALVGLSTAQYDLIIKIKDGKLQQMITTETAATAKANTNAAQKLISWMETNHTDDLRKLTMGSSHNRELGELWSKYCKAYIASLK